MDHIKIALSAVSILLLSSILFGCDRASPTDTATSAVVTMESTTEAQVSETIEIASRGKKSEFQIV